MCNFPIINLSMRPDGIQDDVAVLDRPVNVSKVRQLSPFRYPGGKTWLIPEIRRWICSLDFRPTLFVEPFAGGGIASLTVAFENLAGSVLMTELDPDVASVWHTIFNDPEYLCKRISSFEVNLENVKRVVSTEPKTIRHRAFRTIVKNRTQRGGILAPGASLVRSGENGKGLMSRWYPETLVKRIMLIYEHRHKITFKEEDGFDSINRYSQRARVAFFIDPPYTAGGKRAGSRLYLLNQIDHPKLFDKMKKIRGAFLMTYDDSEEVVDLAEAHKFAWHKIAMKSTHHAVNFELLIKRT
jgi:DNA adenine methylase